MMPPNIHFLLRTVALAVLILQGCSSAVEKNSAAPPGLSPAEKKPSMAVFCRIAETRWRRVLDQDQSGVLVDSADLSFADVWEIDFDRTPRSNRSPERRNWNELLTPLPSENIPCIGYALTYPGHRAEVSLEKILFFEKNALPERAQDDIAHREHLDFEAEIGVLLHKGRDDRFGYMMINDLTDRGVQARTFDSDNMAPGFSKAKSFEGALRVGPLIAVGNEASWQTLQVDLLLNGTVRQRLRANECLLKPGDLVGKHFDGGSEFPWLLIATGTTDGVLFQAPGLWDKIELFFGAGFSMEEATEDWLEQIEFLKPMDYIELRSPNLGRAVSRVVQGIDL